MKGETVPEAVLGLEMFEETVVALENVFVDRLRPRDETELWAVLLELSA